MKTVLNIRKRKIRKKKTVKMSKVKKLVKTRARADSECNRNSDEY